MKKSACFIAIALLLAFGANANAATISFVDDLVGTIDVFYTPSAGLEYNAWDLVVTPSVGGLLDPNPGNRDNDVNGGLAADTWANGVFSSFGAGDSSYIFTEYHPGQAFPPIPQDPLPSAGGTPDRLEWTMFDVFTGDGAIGGLTPYHMGRVLYSNGGQGQVEVRFFENGPNPDQPETASTPYGIPEPGTFVLAGLGLIGIFASRRR